MAARATRRLLVTALLGLCLTGSSAMAVEEPPYHVILKEAPCEVREYPELIAAEVTVSGDRDQAITAGFRLLAGYIFGDNIGRRKIAMTAPVVQEAKPEKIAMTAPVLQQASGSDWIVRFIMPKSYSLETLPVPTNSKVHLVKLPLTRFAVVSFSGLTQAADIAKETQVLKAFIDSHHLQIAGSVSLARYDPPWTPWFLRRNEVMVPIS